MRETMLNFTGFLADGARHATEMSQTVGAKVALNVELLTESSAANGAGNPLEAEASSEGEDGATEEAVELRFHFASRPRQGGFVEPELGTWHAPAQQAGGPVLAAAAQLFVPLGGHNAHLLGGQERFLSSGFVALFCQNFVAGRVGTWRLHRARSEGIFRWRIRSGG